MWLCHLFLPALCWMYDHPLLSALLLHRKATPSNLTTGQFQASLLNRVRVASQRLVSKVLHPEWLTPMSAGHRRCSVVPLLQGGPVRSDEKDRLPSPNSQDPIQARLRFQLHAEWFYAIPEVLVRLRKLCRQRHILANRSNQKTRQVIADCHLEALRYHSLAEQNPQRHLRLARQNRQY